jgi:hypothetical protein
MRHARSARRRSHDETAGQSARRRHRRRLHGAAVVLLVACVTSCSSATNQTTTTANSVPTSPISVGSSAGLEFRELKLTIPKTGRLCPNPGAFVSTPLGAMFSDRTGTLCYLLGPVLITGVDVHSATVLDTSALVWAVHLQFNDNQWVTKVARPFVNKRVAIVLNGIVQATPTIDPGFAAGDVDLISSPTSYSRSEAINVAASITHSPASKVGVRSVDAPSG